MKISKLKLNLILVSSAIMILFVVLTFSDDSLNSLVINYNDDFVIKEVNIAKDKEEDKKSTTQTNNKVTFINKVAESNKWTFPVRGSYAITTYYSYSHRAIDIYSYSGHGTPILSANNGTVITAQGGCTPGYTSCNGNRGNYIVINHNNNYYTVYMHLANINVRVGDTVSAGQVIATMGNTGQVIPVPSSGNPYGGTHLHYCVFIGEPYRGGYAINPFNLY